MPPTPSPAAPSVHVHHEGGGPFDGGVRDRPAADVHLGAFCTGFEDGGYRVTAIRQRCATARWEPVTAAT